MTQKPIAIQARRVLTQPHESPKAAHQFAFSRVGTDLVLEIGNFDITDLSAKLGQAQKDNQESIQADLFITHRFSLTPQAALSLFEAAQKMLMDLQNAGMIKIGQQPVMPVKTGGMD